MATDGVRVYFPDFQDGRVGLAYVLIGGGEVHHFVTPPEISRPAVADISRDGAELLIRSTMWSETEQPLWIAPFHWRLRAAAVRCVGSRWRPGHPIVEGCFTLPARIYS
ncbi:MAG: hypothetical protein WDO73_01695 [Ignavibacteriota bacterium]